ncbi:MAG TPA: excinuclease ABC subunit C [Candidatus Komeilibacteria bacterium]|nr:excinuclease ABC subunit C [Candidatus Komeilibacteria bacterium]
MSYFVYILLGLKDLKFYTGYSANLKKRIIYQGLVKSTANRRPLKLIFYEVYLNKTDAQRREKYFKLLPVKKLYK